MAVDLSHLRPGGESGGVKPFVLEYLRELAAIEKGGLTLIFLTCSSSHSEVRQLARAHDELICVRHNELGTPITLGNWRSGELFLPSPPPNLLLLLRADLLYTPLISPEFACPGIPTLSTVVDVLHRDYPATLPPESNAQRELLFQELVRISDQFQCISQYTAGQMTKHYGVPANRTFCSHIVIHKRLGTRSEARSESKDGERYFLYPANCWPHKNHETLLVAYRLYQRKHGAQAWRLVLTGHENEAMRRILDSATSLGLEKHVSFHGHLPEAEFAKLWFDAGALVFPSLHEGFGIPLIEAMHFGVPILSSRAGSLPEVAQDAAHYADPLDPMAWALAMGEIANSASLRKELVERGRKRLGEFSLMTEIEEFQQAIHSMVQSPTKCWYKGVHSDGWIETMAILGLPTQGILKIELGFSPGPVPRRVRLYRGLTPLGGFAVPAGQKVTHRIEIKATSEPLIIEVPDASNLNRDDHRQHGVILVSALATDELGQHHNLLKDLP